jgi:hypothetical protein
MLTVAEDVARALRADAETPPPRVEGHNMQYRELSGLKYLHYSGGANGVLVVGVFAAIVSQVAGTISPFLGFFLGAVPAFVITAFVYAKNDG